MTRHTLYSVTYFIDYHNVACLTGSRNDASSHENNTDQQETLIRLHPIHVGGGKFSIDLVSEICMTEKLKYFLDGKTSKIIFVGYSWDENEKKYRDKKVKLQFMCMSTGEMNISLIDGINVKYSYSIDENMRKSLVAAINSAFASVGHHVTSY